MIYLNDHEPAHVHVWQAGTVAKIRIGGSEDPPGVVDPGIMRPAGVREAIRIVEANQERFLAAWRDIHGA